MGLGLGMGIGLMQPCIAATSGGGGAFTPASLTGLAGWYDADQQTEAADAAVTTFVDRSGNGKDFTQASAPAKPLLRYAAINGKKALDFDGITSVMNNSGLLDSATAGSWFAVIKLDADPPSGGNPGGAVIDGFGAGDSHHPFTDGIIYAGFGTSVRKTCGNPTPSLASTALIGSISAASDFRFFVNNTTFFSTATNTTSFAAATRQIGKSSASSSFMAGLLAELIVMNTVATSTDLSNIAAYVNTKFGTSF